MHRNRGTQKLRAAARFGSGGMLRAYLESGGAEVWPVLREEFPTDESLLAMLLVGWQDLYDECLRAELAARRAARRTPQELVERAGARAARLAPLLHRAIETAPPLPTLQILREQHDDRVARWAGLSRPAPVAAPVIPAQRRPTVFAREVAGAARQDRRT